jgi:hypothetical protein
MWLERQLLYRQLDVILDMRAAFKTSHWPSLISTDPRIENVIVASRYIGSYRVHRLFSDFLLEAKNLNELIRRQ